MNQTTDATGEHPPSGERVIIDFLRSHPRFFEHHPEILAELAVPHDAGATSLIERQVAVLREQRDELATRLDELYATARENQALADQFHRLLLELLEARSAEELVRILARGLKLHLEADAVSLAIYPEDPESLPAVLRPDDPSTAAMDAARERLDGYLFGLHPVCGPLAPELNTLLFPEQQDAISSAALLPLALGPDFPGLLAVGSTDPERFIPEQGTLFLEQLAEAASCALRAHLADAPGAERPDGRRRTP